MLVAQQIFETAANERELREYSELFATWTSLPIATGIINAYGFSDHSFIRIAPDWTGKVCVEAFSQSKGYMELLGIYYP